MSGFLAVLIQDLRVARAEVGSMLLSVQFFVLGVLLFPVGVGPGPQLLERIGPGVLGAMALLAILLPLERLFGQDYEDGSLDLLLTSAVPLWLVVLAKSLAHWLVSSGPILLAAPILGVMLSMSGEAIIGSWLALLLGTPSLSLIGAVGAALTLGTRRGGVLLALLMLPLYIPVLIFMVGAAEAAATGLAFGGHISILAAILLAAAVLAPWAASAALKLVGEFD